MIKDNKGITTIEIILCFVLVFIMTFSMYGTVSSYNDKRVIEKDKNEILSYKYLLTKTIQDDFVNNELSHVSIENNFEPSGKKTYILHCTLKNGTKKVLKVEQTLGYSTYNPTGLKNQSDSFMISYGTEGDLIEYPLPNLGSSTVEADPANGISEHTVQELSIQDVRIEVLEHQVLSIQIVFYHPNFGNEYGISIMAPVNYVPDINLPLTSYTLIYNDNGGSGCSDKSINKMEDDYWGTLCTPTRTNYTFLEWNTKPDGTGTTITSTSKATDNITVFAKWRKNVVKIRYNGNGGTWGSTSTSFKVNSSTGDLLNTDGSIFEQVISSGDSNNLYNYNYQPAVFFQRKGYHGKPAEEWIAPNGTTFNQNVDYTAETFAMNGAGCDLATGDCILNLKVNWIQNLITIRYKSTTESLTNCSKVFTINNGYLRNSNDTDYIVSSGYDNQYVHERDGLNNFNNENYACFAREWYTAVPGSEWILNSTTFNQNDNSLKFSDIKAAATNCSDYADCTIDLSVNWRRTKICNIYSCNGGTVIAGNYGHVSADIIGNTGDQCDVRCYNNNADATRLSQYGLADHSPATDYGTGTILMAKTGCTATQYWLLGWRTNSAPKIDETTPFTSFLEYVQEVDRKCSPDKCTRDFYEKLKHNDIYIQLYAGWTGTNC